MFSFTGDWRKNIYDSGVLEYDLYKTNNNIIGKFQGFVRSLDYDN